MLCYPHTIGTDPLVIDFYAVNHESWRCDFLKRIGKRDIEYARTSSADEMAVRPLRRKIVMFVPRIYFEFFQQSGISQRMQGVVDCRA